MSLLAHAILLLLLACVTFPAVGDSLPQILTMLPASDSANDELDLVQLQADNSELATEDMLDSFVDSFDEDLAPGAMAEFEDDGLDVTQLVTEIAPDGPEFFGAYGTGERFAFVIDRSSSMTGEKFEVAEDPFAFDQRR